MVNLRLTLFGLSNYGAVVIDFYKGGAITGSYTFNKGMNLTEVFEFSRAGGYGNTSYKAVIRSVSGGTLYTEGTYGLTFTVQCLKR